MSPQPGRVAIASRVPLRRARDQAIMTALERFRLKAKLLAVLRGEGLGEAAGVEPDGVDPVAEGPRPRSTPRGMTPPTRIGTR